MKTGLRKNVRSSLVVVVMSLMIVALACNFPSSTTPMPSQDSSPSQVSPTLLPPTLKPSIAATATPLARPVCYEGIILGATTKDQAIGLLGKPIAIETIDDYEDLLYPSALSSQFDSILLQNQIVVRVDRVLGKDEALKLSAVKSQYGKTDYTAYSNYQHWAKTYIYPEKGLAFTADENLDVVFLKQCFVPMTIDKYKSLWGKDLPTQDPFIK
ncbi:MAG: hypothetical protein HZC38_21620 [Chloroflexi bacterium]|nr:hypothetical protein [Chloroflexota bacterium]